MKMDSWTQYLSNKIYLITVRTYLWGWHAVSCPLSRYTYTKISIALTWRSVQSTVHYERKRPRSLVLFAFRGFREKCMCLLSILFYIFIQFLSCIRAFLYVIEYIVLLWRAERSPHIKRVRSVCCCILRTRFFFFQHFFLVPKVVANVSLSYTQELRLRKSTDLVLNTISERL